MTRTALFPVLLALGLSIAGAPAARAGVGASSTPAAPAAADSAPDARTLVERSVQAMYYAGRDMKARVRMEIVEANGMKKHRLMTVLRLDLAGGDQKYLLYFHEPGDVRRMTCMVNKYAGRDDDRWIFVPLVNRIRRVTAPERSRFLGSDFLREEFSGRDAVADSHTVVRREKRDGRDCWVIESVPKPRTAEYARCTTWIDRETHLPIRHEFRDDKATILRVYTAGRIETVRGAGGAKYPVPRLRTMTAGTGTQRTALLYESVAFDTGLQEADFSEQHMQMQLSDWLPEERLAEPKGSR
jgi:hypothetical protein